MSNTELIAELRDTASKGVSVWGDLQKEAADAIEALESEIQRQYACIRSHAEITHKAEDERDALQAQLAAAQGQIKHLLDDIVEEVEQEGCTHHRIASGKDILFSNMVGACARLLAAPIPQQPSVPEGWKLVPIEPTHLQAKAAADAWLGCDSKLYLNKAMAAAKAMLAAAPQPKEPK